MNIEKNLHLKYISNEKKLTESKRKEKKYRFQMTTDRDERKWILGWADRWMWPGWLTEVAWLGYGRGLDWLDVVCRQGFLQTYCY